MRKWYFTFGFGQLHEKCYHVIKAENSTEARAKMFERFSDKWSMQYDSAKAAGVDKWNLTEIDKTGELL